MKSTCYLKMKTRLRGNEYCQLLCFLTKLLRRNIQPWDKVCYIRSGYTRICFKRWISTARSQTRVEAGSNTSTVTLRVVGGDEKGSLKSETVKYGRENECAGKDQQHI
jgi:hypothetical protein